MNTIVSANSWFRFTRAPLILRAYMVFVLVASAVFICSFYPPVSAAIVPYTGWSSLSYYLFTWYFAQSAVLTSQRKQIYAIVALLGLFVFFGVFDTFQHTWGTEAGRPDFGNPYLTYHPSRPIFTTALPASWLLLLLFPSMRKWIKDS